MTSPRDDAIETIGALIAGLTGMMALNQLPAVDFADLKTMFEREPGEPARIWYVGMASAAGSHRPTEAALAAVLALQAQAAADTPPPE